MESAAVLAVWSQTGKLPTVLPISSQTGLDCYTGKSLQYSHSSKGFRIWSVDSPKSFETGKNSFEYPDSGGSK
jgi:hypothetical protein